MEEALRAAPGANNASTPPKGGLWASAVTPIKVARPVATSTAMHASKAPVASSEAAGKPQKDRQDSVMRALMLALVERWRQRPALVQKKLDVAREKAKRMQVSEARQTQAQTKNEARSDAKKAGESRHNRQDAHRDDRKNHRDSKSGSTSAVQDKRDDRNHASRDTKSATQAQNKKDRQDKGSRDIKQHDTEGRQGTSKNDNSAKKSEERKDHRPGGAGGRAGHSPAAPGGSREKAGHLMDAARQKVEDRKDKKRQQPAQGGEKKTDVQPGPGHLQGRLDKSRTTLERAPKPRDTTQPKADSTNRQPKTVTSKVDTQTAATRPAREAGYRDGHRAGQVVQYSKAYRDGLKDGYRDAEGQGAKEKAALDKARDARKATKEKGMTQTATPVAQKTKDVTPIQVKSVDKNGVKLGAGADKDHLTRGEVRTMKAFERRLKARASRMEQVTERTKGLKAHAEAQAQRAQSLAENTRGVKGGEKLLPKLDQLAEAAKKQAAEADEIHTRAMRSAEKAKTVAANVEKRDGLIYQAVVDSPETEPAEMKFYRGD